MLSICVAEYVSHAWSNVVNIPRECTRVHHDAQRACLSCRSISVRLQPLRRAQLATVSLSSLVTGMAVHPHVQKLHSARKLVAMLPVHRGVAVAVAVATISTDHLSAQPTLTPRGVFSRDSPRKPTPSTHWQTRQRQVQAVSAAEAFPRTLWPAASPRS